MHAEQGSRVPSGALVGQGTGRYADPSISPSGRSAYFYRQWLDIFKRRCDGWEGKRGTQRDARENIDKSVTLYVYSV